ncbi:uncharacterized protein [Salminus brasiliensis]|uniref:uncharacterized protein n=1 Tax=Salminus brasiliensis TaxID=930266 RepID=UPI003B8303DB
MPGRRDAVTSNVSLLEPSPIVRPLPGKKYDCSFRITSVTGVRSVEGGLHNSNDINVVVLLRKMRMRRALALLWLVSLCAAQKKWTQEMWELKDKSVGKSCSNLTQVLDNWKYAIMYQVKDLLVNDHASVLPEYVRIKPLSDAVGDLYKQFDTLKENLAKLSSKFDKVESFVDELQAGKLPRSSLRLAPQRPVVRAPIQTPARASTRGQWVRRARARRGPGT